MSKKLDALIKTFEYGNAVKVAVIHAAFDESPHTVALIDMAEGTSDSEACEKAFMLTNSINDAWWNNKEVTPMFPDKACRSTSVGDMVLVGKTKYKCEPMGWILV